MKQTKIVKVQTRDKYNLEVKIDYLPELTLMIIIERLKGKFLIILIYLLRNFADVILPFVVGTQEVAKYQIFPQILCLSILRNMQIIFHQHQFKIL